MRGLLDRFRHKFLRRFIKSERGATALEFAMVAFPFLYVLGCICETGVMLFTEYTIQSGVQEAAREIRTGHAQTVGLSASAFKSKICETVSILVDCSGKVTVYVKPAATFAALKTTLPSFLNVGSKPDGTPNPTSYSCGQPSEAAAVIATYDWTFSLPFMSFLGNINDGKARRLAGIVVFQNEPFPAGGACS